MKKWQLTLSVTIIFSVIGMLGADWTYRPIIDYYMEIPDKVNFEQGFLRVSLCVRNRGKVDASLILIVTVRNANLSVEKMEPWITHNETQVKFHVIAISGMETYARYDVYVQPIGNPQNFTVMYTIEDSSNPYSISGLISRLFLEPKPYYPTFAVYNKTDTNTYELVK